MNKKILVVLLAACATFGCQRSPKVPHVHRVSKTHGDVSKPELSTGGDKTPSTSLEMAKVNYVAAVIFEGGPGSFNPADPQNKALWRVYICLKKTSSLTNGSVDLDFSKLGHPYQEETSVTDTNGREIKFNTMLGKVHIDYSYTTKWTDDPALNHGYADGETDFSAKSAQIWSTIKNMDKPPVQDLAVFNPQITSKDLSSDKGVNYQINGQDFYIAQRLERFAYSQPDQTQNVIEVCERNGTEVVWQFGADAQK